MCLLDEAVIELVDFSTLDKLGRISLACSDMAYKLCRPYSYSDMSIYFWSTVASADFNNTHPITLNCIQELSSENRFASLLEQSKFKEFKAAAIAENIEPLVRFI